MYCLTNLCYVCLESKNNLISSVDSSLSVNKELRDIFDYCAHNLTWFKTKRIILICEECCSRLRETYQFLKMWHKNSAILQGYMDELNTENKAEPLVHLKDINQVKCEIKVEKIYTDEYEPIIEETQDVFVNAEDPLTIEEGTWKKEETDDREEYPMDNNSTDSVNNESNSEISVNNNTHITDTDRVDSGVTCKQAPATNKTDSNTPANKPHTCATCSKSYNRKADLKIHTRIHTGEKPYKCDWCDKCFSAKSCLVSHMRFHTGEKPHKCDFCDKCFSAKSCSVSHMRLHTGEKPYKCDRCTKCFVSKSHLVSHMLTHTGEKPYKCDRCEKCFSAKSSLVSHMRIHTGEKPYKCDRCEKCFVRKSNLMIHMRTHTGETPFKCVQCDKYFRYPSSLAYHMRTHTGNTF